MKTYWIFISLCLLSACSRPILAGRYALKGSPEVFNIFPDSTFSYVYASYHIEEHSSGKWFSNGKSTIILNSYLQNRSASLIIDYAEAKDKNYSLETNFKTVDPKKYKCAIFLNDTLFGFDKSGKIVRTDLDLSDFNKEFDVKDVYFRYIRCDLINRIDVDYPINSVLFKIVQMQSEYSDRVSSFSLEAKKGLLRTDIPQKLSVQISFSDSLFNYHIFSNEKIRVTSKGLYVYNRDHTKRFLLPRIAVLQQSSRN